jgi:hypothetical protein
MTRELAEQAEAAALRAVRDQGLSVAQYEDVVATAETDPEPEERLLTAVQAAA